jgi:C4-dicarboxylate transporter DctM subunit
MPDIFSSSSFWLIVLFLVPILLRVPIAVCLGLAACFVLWKWNMGMPMISYNFYASIYKFPLLAIPFFILAGIIMEKAGIAERLIRLAREVVGDITGGLAVATVIMATFWGAVSGSGPATVAALGLILIPGMVAAGYDKPFATSTVCVSSGLAIVIPPSIIFIVYGDIMSVSIGALFAAGILPGFVIAACLVCMVYIMSRIKGYRGSPRNPAVLRQALRESFWGLIAPVIILGGIYGGVFTPTEAAVVAVFYGLFVGFCVYRTLTLKMLGLIMRDTMLSSSLVMFIVGCAGLFAWVGNSIGLIPRIAHVLLGVSDHPTVVLLLINVMLFFAGMILDAIAIMYVFMPILLPILVHFGWNPVWFGVMATVNMAIGQVTPPVAVNLFVGCNISGLSMDKLILPLIPLIAAVIVALVIIVAFPGLSLFLPELLGLM